MTKIKLFALNGNKPLAQKIAATLNMELSPATVKHFADGEISIEIEKSIRGADVYVIQSVSDPVNENFMELMIMIDALRRASAHQINVVIPYYGYARADRKARSREPITAKMVANMLEMDGVDRVITVDLHAGQLQGFFDIPVDHLRAMPLLAKYFIDQGITDNVVAVAPDHSGTKLARKLAERFGSPLAIVDARPNSVGVIGDVKDKTAIIIDDMIDTGMRIEESVNALKAAGVKDIYAAATHAVLSAGAAERLRKLDVKKYVVTDTINIPAESLLPNMVQISVGHILGEAIKLISTNQSLHDLFED